MSERITSGIVDSSFASPTDRICVSSSIVFPPTLITFLPFEVASSFFTVSFGFLTRPATIKATAGTIIPGSHTDKIEIQLMNPGTHSSVTFLGMPLGSVWRCLLLQRTTVSRQVHSLGHWGLGTQLDSSWPGKKGGAESITVKHTKMWENRQKASSGGTDRAGGAGQ